MEMYITLLVCKTKCKPMCLPACTECLFAFVMNKMLMKLAVYLIYHKASCNSMFVAIFGISRVFTDAGKGRRS